MGDTLLSCVVSFCVSFLLCNVSFCVSFLLCNVSFCVSFPLCNVCFSVGNVDGVSRSCLPVRFLFSCTNLIG